MKYSDKKLLEIYRQGWVDRADDKPKKKFSDRTLQTAYTNGGIDIVGDDCRSIDSQSDEEILSQIKKQSKNNTSSN